MKLITTTALIFLLANAGWCQVVDAGFSIPSQACIDQNVTPDNQSTGAVRYEWDLCQGDLTLTPSAETVRTLGGSVTTGIDMVFDGTNWFGFITSQGNSNVLRLDFGSSIYSTPTLVNLGNIGGKTNSPTDIKIVSENGNWYGFVYNLADPLISRIDFGTSLTNTSSSPSPITATSVVTGAGTVNGGFDIMHDGTKWNLVLTRNSAVSMIRLPSVTGVPAAPEMILDVPDLSATALGDVVLTRDGNNFYGFVVAWGNKTLQRLSFGTNLFSTPTITNLPIAAFSSVTPYGVDIGVDDGHYLLFISTLEGSMMRIDLGTDLSAPGLSATVLGNFSILENTLKMRLIKHLSGWIAVAPSWASTNLYRIVFPNPGCSQFATVLTTAEPVISFQSSGARHITLRAFESSGWFSEENKTITITTNQSPSVDFTVNGICAANLSAFVAQVSGGVQTYDWQFGDTGSDATAAPTHTYAAAGSYTVDLEISVANGCINSISKDISVYNQPVTSFSVPSGLVCTNNEFVFTNATTDNFNGNLTYQWLVNSTLVSTARDLLYSFPNEGDNDVELVTSIPGCSDNQSHVISNMPEGPVVGFTVGEKCTGNVFQFNNISSGDIVGYSWSFDDGNASTDTDPTNTFAIPDVYDVRLTATATNGCVSSKAIPISVFSTPAPAFTLDLPPFSCSGTPSQFHDATPSMTDGNVQSWNWTFGDSGSGVGKDPTHTYTTAGPYTVRLAVTTDRGCSNFADQQINITASPVALFNFDPACASQPTHFTDISTGGITSWQWKVGSTVYATQNPVHTFASPGNFNMQLLVTGQNSCTNILTRQVVVPVVPTVDFLVTNPCSGQPAVFNDITANAADPITQQTWTFNNIGTASGQQASYSFDTGGVYPVDLKVQGQSGCSYTLTRPVTIRTSPVASFTMSDQNGPPPLHVIFTNTSVGAASYSWTPGDGTPQSTAVSMEHTFNTLGDYNVSLTALSANGCTMTEMKVVNVITPIDELELEDFSLVQASGTSAYQGFLRVRNNGNYRVEYFIVNYDVGGGVRLSETVPAPLNIGEVKTFLLATTFTQPGAAAFICAELNIDTNPLDNKACYDLTDDPVIFNVNPNPASSFVNIESINADAGEVRVRLYNTSGGMAYDRSFNTGTGLSRLSIDVQNLSPGMYVAVVTAGGKSVSARLFIHH